MLPEPRNNAVCIACTARCCYQYRVQITGADVYRLARGLSMHPKDFAMVVHTLKKQDSPDAIYFNAESEPFELCLHKHPKRRDKSGNRPCPMLVILDRDHQRCGVYAHRPMVCRLFPTYTHNRGVNVNNASACPPRSWSIERIDIRNVELLQKLWFIEMTTYRGILQRWNREARKLGDASHYRVEFFFDWLLTIYSAVDSLFQPLLVDEDSQRLLARKWAAAQDLEATPWNAVGTEKHEAVAQAFGEGHELLQDLHDTVEALSGLKA